MVAESSSRFTAIVKSLFKLKASQNGFSETGDWQRAIAQVFQVHQLSGFLDKDSCIQVPPDQAIDASCERKLQQILSSQKLQRQKANGDSLKVEPAGSGDEEDEKKPTKIVAALTFQEKLLRRNIDKQKVRQKAELEENALRGYEERPVLFVDPMTICPKSEFHAAKKAAEDEGDTHALEEFAAFTVEIIFESETCVAAVENKDSVSQRLLSWNLLWYTVEDCMDKNILRSITVGDTHRLWETVRHDLTNNHRGVVVEKLQERFDRLEYREHDEKFGTFVKRFQVLIKEMEGVSMSVDVALSMSKIGNIMAKARPMVKDIWNSKSDRDDYEKIHPLVILKEMEAVVMRREKAEARQEEKNPTKKDQRRLREEVTMLRTQVAAQGNRTLSDHLRGVCLFYQTNDCRRANCTFEHVKLSKEEGEQLKSLVSSRGTTSNNSSSKKEITCYSCRNLGHYSSECPQKKAFAGNANAVQGGDRLEVKAALKTLEKLSAAEKLAFASLLCGANEE